MFRLLKNADVYAPKHLGIQNILTCHDKIVYLGTDSPQLPTTLDVEEIDLKKKRVIPGLIDAHVHVTGGGGESGYASRVPPVPLSQFTKFGVTTVVGVLGTDDCTRSTSSLVMHANRLNEEGMTAYCHTGGYHIPPTTFSGSVKSDIVHLHPVIGVGEVAISDHRSSQPTLDEILRLASETHVAGLMTGKAGILHLHMGDGDRGLEMIRQALKISEIPARTFNPTHCNRREKLFNEACELVGQGCTIDLTAAPDQHESEGLSAHDALAKYIDAKLPMDKVTISSDGGGCLPVFDSQGELLVMDVGTSSMLIQTLANLMEAGRKLEDVLPTCTTNVAKLLRFANKGFLGVGADADLVVLSESHQINDVMAKGQWHFRGGKIEKFGTYEEQKR